MAVATIEAKRRQLQSLYLDLIQSIGIQTTHRLLSAALIERRSKDKGKKAAVRQPVVRKRQPVVREPKGPTSIVWKGSALTLGDAMRRLNSRQQLFVLAHVHDGLSANAAARMAGYKSGCEISATIKAAIAEEKRRVMR